MVNSPGVWYTYAQPWSRRIETARRAVPINECFLLLPQGILERDQVRRSLELFATRVMPRFA